MTESRKYAHTHSHKGNKHTLADIQREKRLFIDEVTHGVQECNSFSLISLVIIVLGC